MNLNNKDRLPYIWHSGANPVNPKWTLTTGLLPDEILSSWLIRTALYNGCDPLALTGILWPKSRPWTLDIDRLIDVSRLETLVDHSGVPATAIQSATLFSIASLVNGNNFYAKAVWPWILTLGARNTKRKGGMQYCPRCLGSDKRPYYRIQWRLAWHTVCEKHHTVLKDRCHVCSSALEPHRLSAEDHNVCLCATCKSDLSLVTPSACHKDVVTLQNTIDQIAIQQIAVFQSQAVQAVEWFALFRAFISVIKRMHLIRTLPQQKFCGLANINLDISQGRSIEQQSVLDRQRLLKTAFQLISMPRDQLYNALRDSNLSRQGLWDYTVEAPLTLDSILQHLPDARISSRRNPTRHSRKRYEPRPRSAVMRMMSRLEQRIKSISLS